MQEIVAEQDVFATRRIHNVIKAPLTTPESLKQSWTIDIMHDALTCYRRFRTINVVDDFNREALAIEIDLNGRRSVSSGSCKG